MTSTTDVTSSSTPSMPIPVRIIASADDINNVSPEKDDERSLPKLLSLSPQFRHNFRDPRSIQEEEDEENDLRMKKSSSPSNKVDPGGICPNLDEATIQRTLRQSESVDINDSISLDFKNESKVLVLYTGGTIGMVRNTSGALAPLTDAFEAMIRSNVTMHDEVYSSKRFKGAMDRKRKDKKEVLLPLVLPDVPNHKRVIYTIYEYHPLLDSSNMTMDNWIQIAEDISHSYKLFDGFVVLHGTDTLAYTASALSFMLENLGKPVIITGSQIPCFETRSDGRDNFVGALILAGNYSIPEVCVYFRHKLLRGNRTVKISCDDLNAFSSPNMSPLVRAGIDMEVDYRAIHRPHSIAKFRVHTTLNRNVVLLRLFPSIRTDTVAHFLKPPIQGVVLQCYGSGNVPSNRRDIMDIIAEATARGVIIVSVTQCASGGVSGGIYETGKALFDCGVVPGGDITPEAALAKLSYVLTKEEWPPEEKREMMMTNLSGEMTVLGLFKDGRRMEGGKTVGQQQDMKRRETELEIVKTLAKELHLHSTPELKQVEEVLFPSILCSAVYKNDLSTLQELYSMGADVAVADYDARTPLHVAASEGNVAMLEQLMRWGASVHVRDRAQDTPLKCAIDALQEEAVKVLVSGGAHLQFTHTEMGEVLCYQARQGNVQRLHCYHLAGADLNSRNISHNTPLHMAVETGQLEVVKYLIDNGVSLNLQNTYGQTPKGIAQVLRRTDILAMLKEAEDNF